MESNNKSCEENVDENTVGKSDDSGDENKDVASSIKDTAATCDYCYLYLIIGYYLVILQIFRHLLTLWLFPSNWAFSQS